MNIQKTIPAVTLMIIATACGHRDNTEDKQKERSEVSASASSSPVENQPANQEQIPENTSEAASQQIRGKYKQIADQASESLKAQTEKSESYFGEEQ